MSSYPPLTRLISFKKGSTVYNTQRMGITNQELFEFNKIYTFYCLFFFSCCYSSSPSLPRMGDSTKQSEQTRQEKKLLKTTPFLGLWGRRGPWAMTLNKWQTRYTGIKGEKLLTKILK